MTRNSAVRLEVEALKEGLGGEVTGGDGEGGFLFGRRRYLRPRLACLKSASPQKLMRVLRSTLHLLMFNPALQSVLGEGWGESNNLLPKPRRCHPYAEETRGGGRLRSSLALKVESSIDYHRYRDLVPGSTLV